MKVSPYLQTRPKLYLIVTSAVLLIVINKGWYSKYIQMSISWQSVQREKSCSMRTGRHTDGQAYIRTACIEEDLPLQFDCTGTLSCCKDSCWLIGTWFPTLRGPRLLDLALVINGCYKHATIFGVQKRDVSTMTTISESTESEIRLYYPYAPPVHTHSKLKLITNSLF